MMSRLLDRIVMGCVVLSALVSTAHADIDVNGRFIGFDLGPTPPEYVALITQSGTSISMSLTYPLYDFGFTGSGTFDPVTGVISATGATNLPFFRCPVPGPIVISGFAFPDGYEVEFDLSCPILPGSTASFDVTRCRNGTLDAGEDPACEEAPDAASVPCCDAHCAFAPSGTTCFNRYTGQCDVYPDQCDGTSVTCPDLKKPDGTLCDDHNDCTVSDACEAGVCTPGTPAAPGTSCEDGNPCTSNDSCDASGHCVGGSPTDCGPCMTCNPFLGGCVALVEQGCKKPLSPVSTIRIRETPTRNNIHWRWNDGAATNTADFGDPVTTDDYTLCVFDRLSGKDELRARAVAPHGAHWRSVRTGFGYNDPTTVGPDVVRAISLKPGGDGTASITVKTRGVGIAAGVIPLYLPATVQLRGPAGTCWDAVFVSAQVNDYRKFTGTGGASPDGAFLDGPAVTRGVVRAFSS
jgi:hypothetical protein